MVVVDGVNGCACLLGVYVCALFAVVGLVPEKPLRCVRKLQTAPNKVQDRTKSKSRIMYVHSKDQTFQRGKTV